MKPNTANLIILALALLVAVALLNLVANLNTLGFGGDGVSLPPVRFGLSLGFDPLLLFLILGIGAAGFWIAAYLKYRPRAGRFPFGELIPIVVAVVVLFALVILMEPTPPDEIAEEETGAGQGDPTGTQGEPTNLFDRLSRGFPVAPEILPLVLAFVAVAAIFMLMATFRRRRALSWAELTRQKQGLKRELREALEGRLYSVRMGEDVRSAIVGSYRDMVHLFRSHGLRDAEHLTAREVEELALANLGLSSEASADLRRLFEEARYSVHSMSDDQRSVALESLRRVKRELGA